MGICVALQEDGTLVPTGESVDTCSGYVLVSGSEHEFYSLVHQMLDVPTPDRAAGWFVGALGAVMFWYVAARMAGSVVAMFSSRPH